MPRRKIKRKGSFYVYILKCRNGTFYTGFTNDLKRRFSEHTRGCGAKYLRGKGPLELVYAKRYAYFLTAMRAEQVVKKKSRVQKEKIITEAGRPRMRVKM